MCKRINYMKKIIIGCVAVSLVCSMLAGIVLNINVPTAAETKYPYLDSNLTAEERALDLVSRMTSEEKYAQLRARTAPAISRLGVKAYDWWSEGLHGVARDGKATSFPTGLGMAATWDPDMVKNIAGVISDEAREKYNSGRNDHGLNYWSPTINMARDPRWGRTEETYGEDPYLTAQIAEGFIEGLQGEGDTYKTIATAKHFLGNNSEQNRHNGSSNIDERDLREYYTRAFKDVVESADVGSVMTSYNAVNGVPMSVNRPVLDGILRRTWGFDGFVVTDCWALNDVLWNHTWRPDGWNGEWGGKETAAYAVSAGVDLNCGYVLPDNAGAAVRSGLISENDIDRALVRLFTARMKTGEFDADGGIYGGTQFDGGIESKEHRQLAEDSANNAVVLLENKDNILPLTKDKQKIALVGDLANEVILGDYSTDDPQNISSPKDGIEAALRRINPAAEFVYIEGGNTSSAQYMMNTRGPKLLDANGNVLRQIDLSKNSKADNCQIENNPANIGYTKAGCWVKFDAGVIDFTNVKKFSVEMSGASDMAAATRLEIRATDPKTGPLLGTIDSVNTNGWDDFRTFTFDAALGGGYTDQPIYIVLNSIPPRMDFTDEEKAAISDADAVIYFAGTRPGENGYFEESDGINLDLPNSQAESINKSAELNKNIIVYIQAVSQVNIEPFRDNVKGILWSTYNGQAQGNAAGRILFGEVNPSAKLPFTWYTNVGDLADIKDYTIRTEDGGNGRGYQYFKGAVTYPFGYGKSYSSYVYSNISIDKTSVTPNDMITVEFDVKNTSDVDGSEAAQLYIVSPDAAEKNRPAKRLEGFDKKTIAAGRTVHYTISVPMEDLWYWDADNDIQCYDAGEYTVQVGPDSENTPLTVQFTLGGTLTPKLNTVKVIPSGHILKVGGSLTAELSASRNNQSFVDLDTEGIGVYYTSSNSNVAEVDADGTVRGVGTGIATITTYVTENGITKSDSYPVKVMDEVEETTPPVEEGNPPKSFNFTSADIDKMKEVWTIENEDSSAWSMSESGLTINTQAGDLYQESKSYKNLFAQRAAGDWTIETEIRLGYVPKDIYQQAAVMAYEDDDNYVKLSYEYSPGGAYVQLGMENNSTFTSISTNYETTENIIFKLIKNGNEYTAYYSVDGSEWQDMGSVKVDLHNVKFTLLAQNGDQQADSLPVTFKSVIVNGKPDSMATAEPTETPKATSEPTVTPVPSGAPTSVPTDSSKDNPTVTTTPGTRITPAPVLKKLRISAVKCRKGSRKIKGKVSVSKAKVKIKVGTKAYRKAAIKGKKFTLKVSRLRKNTKIKIKVTKNGYKKLIKVYKVK